MSVESKKPREACCSKLKLFLASLALVYFAKAFGGSYMKSSITQIERRFDIPSSLTGVIDGSFEIGNLLVIAFVSYFGAKFHRPRLIGVGCLVMALGCFLTAMPHFFQGLYKYETSVSHNKDVNSTEGILPCMPNHSTADAHEADLTTTDCEKASGSSMWILVFLGNMLRGIGETPIMPLGVSYLDDFARKENTPMYLACIHTAGMVGPMVGFMLGSYLSKIYVDIGSVDLDSLSINYKDSRWVGAWWLGFIITGMVALLSSIPFWFLPKSLAKQGQEESQGKGTEMDTVAEQESFLPDENQENKDKEKPATFQELAKDFIPSLKRLFSNSIYSMMILTYLVAVNGFIGLITFKPKYMEQIYGQPASKSIFLIGTMNLPAVALGIITGGYVLKRFKLGIVGAARVAIAAVLGSFCLLAVQIFLRCENAEVAGLTVSYQGVPQVPKVYNEQTWLSQCNEGCSCSMKHWDPVCADNGLTYASPCLAGCQTSSGTGKEMVFRNCSCIAEKMTPGMNMSAVLGQCPRKSDCDNMFKVYMALSVLGAFISACGGTPGYIVLLRSIQEDLKSLALGMQMLIVRTLGGIPPPIYFGALIDRTCLKWGTKHCGGRGACRIYDSDAFRLTFMGLISGLYFGAMVLWGGLYVNIVRKQKKIAAMSQAKENGPEENGVGNGHASISIAKAKEDTSGESTI